VKLRFDYLQIRFFINTICIVGFILIRLFRGGKLAQRPFKVAMPAVFPPRTPFLRYTLFTFLCSAKCYNVPQIFFLWAVNSNIYSGKSGERFSVIMSKTVKNKITVIGPSNRPLTPKN